MTTEIVEVPDLVNPGIFPTPSGDSAAYNRASRAWADQQQPFANSLVGIAESARVNSLATEERAQIADTKAGQATSSAAAAAADALRLETLDALWLGALAADPATGRNGAPLVAGNAYVNTETGYIRAYNGTAWVQGVSAVSGVTSLNSQIGDLILKTIGGQSVLGSGNISFSTFEIGDARPTVSPPSADWLEANKIYLQSSYPELFAHVGLQPNSVAVSFDAGPAAAGLNGIASNGQEIVAVTPTLIRRRTAGVWGTVTPPVSASWAGVGHGNGTFVIVANGPSTVALTSTDNGASWVQRTLPSGAWYLVVCEETSGYWMAIGSTQCAVSRNGGATWVTAAFPSGLSSSSNLTLAAAGDGKFLLTSRGSNIANVWMATVTAGAVTWASVPMPSSTSWFGSAMQGGALIIAGGTAGNLQLCSTTDGGATFATRLFSTEAGQYLVFGCTPDLTVVGLENGATLTLIKNGPVERRSPPMAFGMTWPRGVAIGTDYAIAAGASSSPTGILRVTGKSYDPASQFYLPEPTVVTPPFKNWVKAK